MRSLFGRLLPRSITAQITLIVTVSVILGVVLVVGALLTFFNDGSRNKPLIIAVRIANVTMMVQAARSDEEAAAITASAQATGINVRRVPLRDLVFITESVPMPVAKSILAGKLESIWGLEVVENAYLPNSGTDLLVVNAGAYGALLFDVLQDASLWSYLLPATMLSVTIVLIFASLLSIYAVCWIIAPLRALAEAAHSFGRSPDQEVSLNRGGPLEITRVADAVDEMRIRIRTLIENRTRMLTAISHDLYTPLTRLGLRAERIEDDGLRKGITHEIGQITRMLDETLDYLREDVRSECASRVDLPSVLQTICAEFADVGHAVSYEGPSRLTWNCRAGVLTRAISNVVDNAVKHGSIVVVALRATQSGTVEIDVSDDGPGIAQALRGQVFDPFVKGDEARSPTKRSGFGLGLSIARDVVRGHGGDIALLDRSPHGLIVRLTLPGAPGNSTAQATA